MAHWKKVKWVEDAACTACTVCNRRFGMVYRRRHCRCCGRIFCQPHCRTMKALAKFGYLTPVKNCDLCVGIGSSIAQYKANFMLRQAEKLDPAWKSILSEVNGRDLCEVTDYYDIRVNEFLDANSDLTIVNRNWKVGDYSIVHSALYETQPVAIKVYKFWLQANTEELNREVECLNNIQHRGVLPLVGISKEFGKFPFIITPLAKLGTLQEYLLSSAAFPWINRYRVLVQVAEALHHLHTRHSLLHNDVCAANIVVSSALSTPYFQSKHEEVPVLVQVFDFNSARSVDVTTEWSILPRPTHCSPEAFRLGKYSTPAEMYGYCVFGAELFGRCNSSVFSSYTKFIAEISDAVIDGSLRPILVCEDNSGYENVTQVITAMDFFERGWLGAEQSRPTFRDALTTFNLCVEGIVKRFEEVLEKAIDETVVGVVDGLTDSYVNFALASTALCHYGDDNDEGSTLDDVCASDKDAMNGANDDSSVEVGRKSNITASLPSPLQEPDSVVSTGTSLKSTLFTKKSVVYRIVGSKFVTVKSWENDASTEICRECKVSAGVSKTVSSKINASLGGSFAGLGVELGLGREWANSLVSLCEETMTIKVPPFCSYFVDQEMITCVATFTTDKLLGKSKNSEEIFHIYNKDSLRFREVALPTKKD